MKLWQGREDFDIIIIRRRMDRRRVLGLQTISRALYTHRRLMTTGPVHGPGLYRLPARREVAGTLVRELGETVGGFWWEFDARAHQSGS